jgi:hypothetical protein
MTLQDAVKSGRPFKRPFQTAWLVVMANSGVIRRLKNPYSTTPVWRRDDIFADDYEVKPSPERKEQ